MHGTHIESHTRLTQLEADLGTVPGVGPTTKQCFIDAGVKTTYQLFGKFLMLKDPSFTTQQHCDAFLNWIKDIGIKTGYVYM